MHSRCFGGDGIGGKDSLLCSRRLEVGMQVGIVMSRCRECGSEPEG